MLRIVIENVLLFLLPTAIWVTYVYLTRDEATGVARVLDDAPLMWLAAAGAAIVFIMLFAFGSTSGGKPGQAYVPPSIKDGRIEPGRVR